MAYISFQPKDFFKTILYTGNDGASQAQTGVGFSADLTWIKDRDATEEHVWTDTVRGATYWIRSNTNAASAALATGLLSWQSDGFTVGNNGVVGTTDDYVAYNWKAGTTSGLTGGSITPSAYSFSTTSCFSMIRYTGTGAAATIPHGLGVVPKMIMVKQTNGTNNWIVYHAAVGAGKEWILNNESAPGNNSNVWNDTVPTSTVFSVANDGATGANTQEYIAYCFGEKKGFSKIGSFIGDGSATNGPFIYTGFRPAWVLIRNTTTTNRNWGVWNDKSLGYNEDNNGLYPNVTSIEGTGNVVNLLSNGFKVSTSDNGFNGSGNELIYMAFAEFPLLSSNGIPGVAR